MYLFYDTFLDDVETILEKRRSDVERLGWVVTD